MAKEKKASEVTAEPEGTQVEPEGTEAEPIVEPQQPKDQAQQTTWDDGTPFDPKRAKELIDNLRNEVRALKPKAKKADELEEAERARKEAEMTEAEKASMRIKELETQIADQGRKEAQRTAAEKVGLPSQFIDRLIGDTPEALEADAKVLLEAMRKKTSSHITTTNPGNTSVSETDAQRRRRLGLG